MFDLSSEREMLLNRCPLDCKEAKSDRSNNATPRSFSGGYMLIPGKTNASHPPASDRPTICLPPRTPDSWRSGIFSVKRGCGSRGAGRDGDDGANFVGRGSQGGSAFTIAVRRVSAFESAG